MLDDCALRRLIWLTMRIAAFDRGYSIAAVEGCLFALRETRQITLAQNERALQFRDRILRRRQERAARRKEALYA